MQAHFIVTANRLDDGSVTYLGDQGWVPRIDDAWISAERDAADERLAWAADQEAVICDPYVLPVDLREGRPEPQTARERIRAEGPMPTLSRLGYR